jgi:hypothetical protein
VTTAQEGEWGPQLVWKLRLEERACELDEPYQATYIYVLRLERSWRTRNDCCYFFKYLGGRGGHQIVTDGCAIRKLHFIVVI